MAFCLIGSGTKLLDHLLIICIVGCIYALYSFLPHVSCAIKNCKYFEYFVPEDNYRLPMKGDLPIDEYGIIHVPDKPGVGVELDWDLIKSACHNYICQEYKG